MFEGFEEFDVACSGATIHGRRGGDGPPLLLLHGIPETHLMWHRVAPGLASEFTVVATDLRGYGDSGKPASADDHSPYAMRQVAQDQVEVMQHLGHERFGVVGHDRGARCAYRMALDHPQTVTSLSVLDIVPTGDAFGRADMEYRGAATLDLEHDEADRGGPTISAAARSSPGTSSPRKPPARS